MKFEHSIKTLIALFFFSAAALSLSAKSTKINQSSQEEGVFLKEGFLISEDNPAILSVETVTPHIIFSDKNGNDVGSLDWKSGKFIFKGKAEKSAKIFFEYLKKMDL